MNHGRRRLAGLLLGFGLSLHAFARTIEISPTVSYQGTAAGSGRTIAVTSDIQWHAWSNDDWITVSGGYPSGTGNGTVTYGFASNAGNPARSGTITVAGGGVERTLTLHQAAAANQLALDRYERRVTYRGTWNQPDLRIRVDVTSNVDWTATSDTWRIRIERGASGSGNDFILFSVEGSDASYERVLSFTVSGGGITHKYYVYQDAWPQPPGYLSINKTTEELQYHGVVSLGVNSNLDWTATPNHVWITVAQTLASSVNLTVQPNRGNQPRVGTVTVRANGIPATLTITQAPMPYIYILSPKTRQHYADTHDMQIWSFDVRANTDWEASVNYPDAPIVLDWIEIDAFIGSGNGRQLYGVKANPFEARRAEIRVNNTGVFHTMSDTFFVDQYAAHLEIFPGDRYHPNTVTVGAEIDVTATVSWLATADQPWIKIMAESSGAGDGTIRYDISRNDAFNYRTGTITVTGGGGLSSTYSVVQGGLSPSELSLTSTEREHSHEFEGRWTFSVRANVPWKVSAPWWIVLPPPASGIGNGTVYYAVSYNHGVRRSGNIIVTGGGLTREFAISQAAYPSLMTIPTAWLRRHGLPEDGTRNLEDITGKGMKVYEDWIADTDPNDIQDRFVFFTAEPSGSAITLRWQGKAGRKYLLYRSSATNPLNQASPYADTYISSWGDPFHTVSCHEDGPMSHTISKGVAAWRYYRIGVRIEE